MATIDLLRAHRGFFRYGASSMTQIVIIQLELNKSVDNKRDLKFLSMGRSEKCPDLRSPVKKSEIYEL